MAHAEIAVMGPHGAINIIFRKEIAEAKDHEQKHNELVSEYRQRFASPYIAAQKGYIDEVIQPAETRPKLISALEMLATETRAETIQETLELPFREEHSCCRARVVRYV